METKSRYEVISQLESQKRDLISQRDNLATALRNKEKSLKQHQQQLQDTITIMSRKESELIEDIAAFKDSMEQQKATINELIASVDESLKRMASLNNTSSK